MFFKTCCIQASVVWNGMGVYCVLYPVTSRRVSSIVVFETFARVICDDLCFTESSDLVLTLSTCFVAHLPAFGQGRCATQGFVTCSKYDGHDVFRSCSFAFERIWSAASTTPPSIGSPRLAILPAMQGISATRRARQGNICHATHTYRY